MNIWSHHAICPLSIDMLEKEKKKVLKLASTLNQQAGCAHYLIAEQRPKTAKGWKGFWQTSQWYFPGYRAEGYHCGHNHDFDFFHSRTAARPTK